MADYKKIPGVTVDVPLPGMEFEGPMGFFWDHKEVPIEALAKGVAEIFKEVDRRGWRQDIFMALVKQEASKTP